MTVSQQLKTVIDGYGSQNRLAKDSGVRQQTIQRFMSGARGLHVDTVDRLCEFFDMRLTRPKRKRAKQKKANHQAPQFVICENCGQEIPGTGNGVS